MGILGIFSCTFDFSLHPLGHFSSRNKFSPHCRVKLVPLFDNVFQLLILVCLTSLLITEIQCLTRRNPQYVHQMYSTCRSAECGFTIRMTSLNSIQQIQSCGGYMGGVCRSISMSLSVMSHGDSGDAQLVHSTGHKTNPLPIGVSFEGRESLGASLLMSS